jgi:outer membrane protein assembly factor BamA
LFDRFSLGNTQTLRGWNKFELAPLGGNRMVHGSLRYAYDDVQLFYDTGTVWDAGAPIHLRSSLGVGFGDEEPFIALAFRIRGARLAPAFFISLRF